MNCSRMEIIMEKINIEEIMDEIRADIKEKGLTDNEIVFDDIVLLGGGTGNPYDQRSYKDGVSSLGESMEVLSYRELSGNPIAKIVKKINRRLVAFYIESIVDDQNIYNKNVYKLFNMNISKFKEDDDKIAGLEKKLYECEKRMKDLEAKLSEN